MDCSIIPQVKNKQGELVDSKLFKDLLSLSENREEAKTRYLQTRTNEFKSWFGDWENFPDKSSKVVDENGEPLVVYHGSKSKENFKEFKESLSDRGIVRNIFFFTPEKGYAEEYGNVNLGYYLNVKNLLDNDRNSILYEVSYGTARRAKEAGYDGILGTDDASEILVGTKIDSYGVFNSNQIKSLANSGKFSKTDDNIYHQIQSDYKTNNKELDEQVGKFLKQIGVDVKSVQSIQDSDGNKLDSNGVANLLTKTIDVVNGQAKLDTLPEEASHFLVQILKQNGSPLYNSMKSELPEYDLYKQTLAEYGGIYQGRMEKLQDEAMAKIIASQIVDKFEQTNKQSRVATWFNRVMNFIKEKLGLIDKDELDNTIIRNNPFSEAADLIYSKNHTNFKWDETNNFDEESAKFYQLQTPKNIEDRIRNKFDISLGEDGYVRLVDGKPVSIANRVSDKVNQDVVGTKSAGQKLKDELQKVTGVKGHADLQNIVERVVAERDGKVSPARKVRTDVDTYNTLERYVRQMVEGLPADARIITGQPIYEAKTDTAGTPNMLVVHPDGKVDIIQWAFTTLTKGGKTNKLSELTWDKRLQEYKNILAKNYGVTKFGKVRTIPIETKFDDGFLTSIRTGDQTFKTSPELDPLPISEELTGNEKLDRVISTLLVKKTTLENSKPVTSASVQEKVLFKENKRDKLERVSKAIRDIQLKQDVKQFVDIGLSAIQELADTPVNQYSEAHLLDLQKTMQFYGKEMLNLVSEQVKDFSDVDKTELNRLVTESQLYSSNIEDEVARRLLSITGDSTLNDAQKQTGVYTRMFRTISQQSNPVIKSFWSLVQGSKTKTRQAVVDLNERVKSAVDGLREAQPGIDSGKLFDFMLKRNGDNTNIAPKFDSEFYKKLSEARESKNIDFLEKHTTFDGEAYEKAFNDFEKTVVYQYRNDVDKEEKISDRIKNFRAKYSDSPSGRSRFGNPYVSINEDRNIYSKEYKNIIDNPKLKAFYDLWMKESSNFQDYIGKDLGKNYVWNVHNGLIDSFRENGFGAFTNMSSILDHLESKAGETLGMIDPETGRPLYELPTYYTDSYNLQNQSRDLGKVLSLVGAMAYNHRYMGEIEGTSKMLEIALENQQEIQTDNNGNPIKNKLTNAIAKAVGSSNTLDQYRDYMNYYLYGVKNKTKDYVVKIGDRNFSTLAAIDGISKWFVGKSLSANPVSIVAHAIRGETNVRIIGAMGRFFNNTQYTKAIGKLVARDSKFFSLAGYFDLMDGENYKKKSETLSASKLSQYITYDHMFIGHRATDYTVRNGILGAMLESHTYNEQTGKIEKLTGDQKSLSDLIQVKNDKLDFGNIPKEALDGFRNKVSTVGDRVFGMNTRDDINLAKLNVLGRVLMTFRNWIPGMVDTRYRELTHNNDLGEWELGRYRSFWNQVVTKQTIPSLLNGILNFGTFGYGGKFGDRTINRAKELYANYMESHPEADITEQQYVDLHISNLKASMMETYITLSMIGAILAVKKEEGETLQQGSLRKYFSRQINRSLADISFFYNPMEFDNIIKSPIPIVEAYLQPLHLFKALWHQGEDVVGIPHKEKSHELRKAALQMVPGLNGFESLLSFTQADYDKTKTEGSDSGSK